MIMLRDWLGPCEEDIRRLCNLRRNLHDISPGGQRVRVGIARAIYGGLQRIYLPHGCEAEATPR